MALACAKGPKSRREKARVIKIAESIETETKPRGKSLGEAPRGQLIPLTLVRPDQSCQGRPKRRPVAPLGQRPEDLAAARDLVETDQGQGVDPAPCPAMNSLGTKGRVGLCEEMRLEEALRAIESPETPQEPRSSLARHPRMQHR